MRCRYCQSGRPQLCDQAAKAAYTLPDGSKLTVDGFLTIDEEKLAKLSDAELSERLEEWICGGDGSAQIDTQGIADGKPFSQAIEARRAAAC